MSRHRGWDGTCIIQVVSLGGHLRDVLPLELTASCKTTDFYFFEPLFSPFIVSYHRLGRYPPLLKEVSRVPLF